MFILGVITDNKAFFYFSIFLIFIFYLSSLNIKNILKASVVLISMCAIIIACFSLVPRSYLFFLVGMNVHAESYLKGGNKDERMSLLDYALREEDSRYFGKGSGLISHAFKIEGKLYKKVIDHLEISDAIIMIYENGLAFYLIFCILYT